MFKINRESAFSVSWWVRVWIYGSGGVRVGREGALGGPWAPLGAPGAQKGGFSGVGGGGVGGLCVCVCVTVYI